MRSLVQIRPLTHIRELSREHADLVDGLLASVDNCSQCAHLVWIEMNAQFLKAAPQHLVADAERFAEDNALFCIRIGVSAGSTFSDFRPLGRLRHKT